MPARGVDELFNDALERRREDRKAFLQSACAGEPELYHRLSSLLKLHDRAGSFLQRPPVESPSVTAKLPDDAFTAGRLLGDRYRIEGLLGRGGMGEVWRAYDLKLRVDVALKRLHKQIFATDQGLELLRQEVRSARNVLSPHVCRIFDLVDQDGQELVSMEYIDGRTLQTLLREKAPLDLREAGEIAAQLLAGLEAIHEADFVHRDVKPANLMITRTGRVVLMDFGLAKGLADIHEGSIAGTPAYMAPEQARGAAIDARADIFAAGVILAEMLIQSDKTSREKLWANVRRQPAALPESPWQDVLSRAVSWDPEARFATARDMARALEEVTLRVEGIEDRTPYPGLSSFTETDAEYFFGREAEVEEVWHKLQRLHLLALIGPSGVGKSSFLRAGLIPSSPEGWRCTLCTPGSSPFRALARCLAPEFAGDTEAVDQLLGLEEPGVAVDLLRRWRAKHHEVLLVVDQFEELFTLNPSDVQARFTQVLSEIALEADVHVLLSMRDDFLFRCHEFGVLKPIFADLTPLGALTGNALRRALVQPALACGYRFEDEALVDEMVEEVTDERGALPLLAFAASRMWEHRQRSTGTLTRRYYEQIGGVGGALAQHAEATLEQIGTEHWDIVRELFRNLITSQGTRVARSTDDLLSVFEDRETAKSVLDQLVDARLLTSFEPTANGSEADQHHRIELVHESLLRSWPRLVRWQTQDADGAQLRDQLRQAAQLWEERSRSDDLLWMGTAYRDFELWRERYPGGLSDSEESFAEAMEARDLRRRRRRRAAVTGTIVTLLAVVAVVGTLWQRSDRAAKASEARRLHMLAEQEIEDDNTLALALATASLEREDSPSARHTALATMWRAPTRFVLATQDTVTALFQGVALSPEGEWLATPRGDGVLLWPRGGGEPRQLVAEERSTGYRAVKLGFHPDQDLLAAQRIPRARRDQESPTLWTLWTIPDGEHLQTWEGPGAPSREFNHYLRGDPPRLLVAHWEKGLPWKWTRYSLGSDKVEELGRADTTDEAAREFTVDRAGRYLLDWKGTGVYLFPIDSLETASPILVGHHERNAYGVDFSYDEQDIVSADKRGEVRVWARQPDGGYELSMRRQTDEQMIRRVSFDRSASRVRYNASETFQIGLLDRAVPQAEPTLFLPIMAWPGETFFPPDDSWIVFPRGNSDLDGEVYLFSLARRRPQVFRVLPEEPELMPIAVSPDGRTVVARTGISELWLCEASGEDAGCSRLWRHPMERTFTLYATDPGGRHVLINDWLTAGRAYLIPLDGTEPRLLEGFQANCTGGVALSPDGLRAAVGGHPIVANLGGWDDCVIRVWDLESDEVQILESGRENGFWGVWFLPHDRLLSAGPDGLLLWDLSTGQYEVLSEREHYQFGGVDAEGHFFVADTPSGATLWDLETRTERVLPLPSDGIFALAMSPDARFFVVGRQEGHVLVQFLDQDQPHLLLGHDGPVTAVSVSADSEKIHSASDDGTVRTWDAPAGRPLQTLPYEEFLDVLRAQTNMRIALDPSAEDGYRVVYDRFPGWEVAPTW